MRRLVACQGHSSGAIDKVGFQDTTELLIIPARDHAGPADAQVAQDAPPRPLSAADSQVVMMGSCSFARLLELDDAADRRSMASDAPVEHDDEGEPGRAVDYVLFEG